jgi:hypothetical protein
VGGLGWAEGLIPSAHRLWRTRTQQRLFDAVYDEGFTYIVHVDIKSDRALIDGIAAYVEEHKGAHLIPSVRYGSRRSK